MKRFALLLCLCTLLQGPALLAQNPPPLAESPEETDTGWPREISNAEQITIYEPQVESWKGNRLQERAAVSVQTPTSAQPTYGVIWLSARTEVDKTHHMVTLENIRIPRASFPSAPKKTQTYLALLRKNTPSLVKEIALDRLQANLAVTQAESRKPVTALKNTPPRIFYSKTPAILVLVDGNPVLRETGDAGFLRVINTRALLVLERASGKYYFYMGDRWMESPGAARLTGRLQWTQAKNPPSALDRIKQAAVQQKVVDLLDQPDSLAMRDLNQGIVPRIYVATGPSELIQTQGDARFQPIAGTKLLYVQNSSDQIFLNTADQRYYILASGRWYRAGSLNGPWLFVSARRLPRDFARIPDTNPKGSALASVAGTPQAREARIANQIPQTATVDRNQARLGVNYDGDPLFKPIEGTPLSYAINTRTAVIEIHPRSYFACQDGIWFAAASPTGPWSVATSIPSVIYTIPPSSRLYYVTFVKVYGFTPEVVYVGYTPGYLGSYYAPDGVVVFGTGYRYTPWCGTFWVGPPVTFGFGWYWGIGYGWGFYPGVAFFPWWGPWWGWGPRVAAARVTIRSFNVNHFNVYRSWNRPGEPVIVRNSWKRNAIATRSYHQRYGYPQPERHNNLYAGRNGHVYRYNSGHWEEHSQRGWQRLNEAGQAPHPRARAAPPYHQAPGRMAGPGFRQAPPRMPGQELERSRMARRRGEQQWNSYIGGQAGHPGRAPRGAFGGGSHR